MATYSNVRSKSTCTCMLFDHVMYTLWLCVCSLYHIWHYVSSSFSSIFSLSNWGVLNLSSIFKPLSLTISNHPDSLFIHPLIRVCCLSSAWARACPTPNWWRWSAGTRMSISTKCSSTPRTSRTPSSSCCPPRPTCRYRECQLRRTAGNKSGSCFPISFLPYGAVQWGVHWTTCN